MAKKLYIKTYGCQMNVYDSLKMADLMRPMGYEGCEAPEGADMVILNTCHIREKAAEKVYSELGRINQEKNRRKKEGGNMIVAVAGCVAQAEGEEIFRRAPYVDVVVGSQSYQNLPDLIGKIQRSGGHQIDLEMRDDKFDLLPEESTKPQGVSACLSIQEGCDKFCSFCVVPYTRGAEYSRNVPEIYREAIRLVAGGAKEITLLGQNVNAFHGQMDGKIWNLGKLITHLARIEGLERIRYSTSHPRDMHEELYEAHQSEPKLMPFLNLPVQSGSNKILAAMNRKHTRDEYFKIIERFKLIRPDMQFSSDFIIGFPGETEQDFADTLDLARSVGFSQAYSFMYSPRPGTPGAEMENQLPEEVKYERLQRFQSLINQQQLKFNQSCEGLMMPVLFDRSGRREEQLVGKSPYMQSVHITPGNENIFGKIVDVKISKGMNFSLAGEVA